MPIHSCEICNFQTEKKSTYTKHIQSKTHLNKVNGNDSNYCSSTTTSTASNTTTADNTCTASRIKELENQLKLKDLEMEKLIAEYELRLKHKDEIISILN